ncbi:20131_t:CDS:2 [Cetraspora pellucida]|uniref:20131_t:CDS:1 n=1 Tax=Cetraspora pellucida TaxID=1433469 RepID=A0A9N8W0L5_9GLOM|nr:20131_t:CDS:2 [Cetraspora pellucida]
MKANKKKELTEELFSYQQYQHEELGKKFQELGKKFQELGKKYCQGNFSPVPNPPRKTRLSPRIFSERDKNQFFQQKIALALSRETARKIIFTRFEFAEKINKLDSATRKIIEGKIVPKNGSSYSQHISYLSERKLEDYVQLVINQFRAKIAATNILPETVRVFRNTKDLLESQQRQLINNQNRELDTARQNAWFQINQDLTQIQKAGFELEDFTRGQENYLAAKKVLLDILNRVKEITSQSTRAELGDIISELDRQYQKCQEDNDLKLLVQELNLEPNLATLKNF